MTEISNKTYAQKHIAQGIATRMTKQTGREHVVMEIEDGFFVVPAPQPQPEVTAKKPAKKRVKTPVRVLLPMHCHSTGYVRVKVGDRIVIVSKNFAQNIVLDEEASMAGFTVPQYYAEKKSLPFEAVA